MERAAATLRVEAVCRSAELAQKQHDALAHTRTLTSCRSVGAAKCARGTQRGASARSNVLLGGAVAERRHGSLVASGSGSSEGIRQPRERWR